MAKVRKRRSPRTVGGVELTLAVVEALAAEAERGYDLPEWERQFAAGPVFADSETLARVTIEIPNEALNRLRECAEAEGKTVERVAREALLNHLDA